jgi:hypothetical protein
MPRIGGHDFRHFDPQQGRPSSGGDFDVAANHGDLNDGLESRILVHGVPFLYELLAML